MPASGATPDSYIYPYRCDRPQNAAYDNLCQERRAARAAEQQVIWAERTFWLGIAGTLFVIGTLVATGVAAWAAQKAAKAASSGVETAAKTADMQLRAYIHVLSANLKRDGNKFIITMTVKNFGQTPARDFSFAMWIGNRPHPFNPSDFPNPLFKADLVMSKETLAPTGERIKTGKLDVDVTPEGADCTPIFTNSNHAVWVIGLIKYKDVFGKEQFTNVRIYSMDDNFRNGLLNSDSSGNDSS